MAFPKFDTSKPIPRQWGLVGYANAGKTTFLTQMRQPLLVIDADGRFREVTDLLGPDAEINAISDKSGDHRDAYRIAEILQKEDLSGIGTILIDSMTPIIQQSVALGMERNARGMNKNRSAAFADKANVMKLIQNAASQPGVDVCFVWHYENGRDQNAREHKRATLSNTERMRLMRSLNAVIELDKAEGRRLARVVWSREEGKKGLVVPDKEGFWRGVPEELDRLLSKNGSAQTA